MSTLDEYVAELDRSLVGPRRAKRDLTMEVRDHLDDAVAAYRSAGLDGPTAQQRAVSEFGSVDDIAGEFQAELGLAQGRRTALLTFAVLLVQPLVWQSSWPWFEGDPGQSAAGFYQLVDLVMESLGGVAISLCAVAVIACGIGTRYLPARRVVARATALLALSCCATFPVLAVVLTSQSTGATSSVALQLVWVAAFLVLPLTWVAVSARRCLRAC